MQVLADVAPRTPLYAVLPQPLGGLTVSGSSLGTHSPTEGSNPGDSRTPGVSEWDGGSHHPPFFSSGSETTTHHSHSPAGAWCWHLTMVLTPARTPRWAPAAPGWSQPPQLSVHHILLLPLGSCLSLGPKVLQPSPHPFLHLKPCPYPLPCPYSWPILVSNSYSSPSLHPLPPLFLLQAPFSSLAPSPSLSLSLFLFPLYHYSCPCPYYYRHPYSCPHPHRWCHSGLSHSCPGAAPQMFRLEIEVMDRHGHNCSGALRVEVLPSRRPRVTFP